MARSVGAMQAPTNNSPKTIKHKTARETPHQNITLTCSAKYHKHTTKKDFRLTAKSRETRFRAYQLGDAGSSFSYFNGESFTLIEARYNNTNSISIEQEISLSKSRGVQNLHITSWDRDHCSPPQLKEILNHFSPRKIEYPGYDPHTDSGKESLDIILEYEKKTKSYTEQFKSHQPTYQVLIQRSAMDTEIHFTTQNS